MHQYLTISNSIVFIETKEITRKQLYCFYIETTPTLAMLAYQAKMAEKTFSKLQAVRFKVNLKDLDRLD
jgi:hypothetical protein